jgi:hypothetical protein
VFASARLSRTARLDIDTLALIDETDRMSAMYCPVAFGTTTLVVDDGDARGVRAGNDRP